MKTMIKILIECFLIFLITIIITICYAKISPKIPEPQNSKMSYKIDRKD